MSLSTLALPFDQLGDATKIIGSRPFVATRQVLGRELHLAARPDYAWGPAKHPHQGRALLDGIRYVVTAEDSVRIGALLAGQAHVIRQIQAYDEGQVTAQGFQIFAPSTRGINNSIVFRPDNALVADVRVRRALLHATDAQEIVETLLSANHSRATSIIARTAQGYVDLSAKLTHDPALAARLLDDAGWAVGPQGIRQKDGRQLVLTAYESLPQPQNKETLQLVAQQWAKLGARLNVLAGDSSSRVVDNLDPERTPVSPGMVGRADPDVIRSQYHPLTRNVLLQRGGVSTRVKQFEDPRLNALLDGIASEPDRARRLALVAEVQAYVLDQAYAIPIFEEPQVFATSPRLRGLRIRHLGRRGGQALLVLLATFTLAFVLLQALPGDAVLIKFVGTDMGLTADQLADIRLSYGADAPVWEQFLHTLGNFLTGNFGYSIRADVPVRDMLTDNLPATLRLAVLGFLAANLLAAALAFLSTLSGFGWIRAAVRSLPSLFVAIPVFWLGIMLIQLFSFQLGLVSVISPGPVEALVLPVLTLAVPISTPIAQILIRSIDQVLTEPFVAVARAKGASQSWVLWHHVARNALLPTLTIAGVLFGELLSGAVVTEAVFGLNGLGGLTQQAVGNQDIAVLQAIVVISATAFVAINLAVDLLYPVLDPRLAVRRRAAP